MKKKEIVEILENFGLSEYESKTYASLVFLGPSKASTISKESQVPQSKIYGILEQLMYKQLVDALGGRPKEFRAILPKIALQSLVQEREKEIESLRTKMNILNGFLKPIKQKKEVLDGIWTTKGKKWTEFTNKVAEMFDKSEKYAYVISRDFNRSAELAESVKRNIKRGIKIRTIGIGDIDETNYYKAKWYHGHGVDIRIFKTKVHPRIILVDGKEVLIRLDHNPTKREEFRFTSLWSEDASLVNVFDLYVKNLWKMAKPVDFGKIKSQIKKSDS